VRGSGRAGRQIRFLRGGELATGGRGHTVSATVWPGFKRWDSNPEKNDQIKGQSYSSESPLLSPSVFALIFVLKK